MSNNNNNLKHNIDNILPTSVDFENESVNNDLRENKQSADLNTQQLPLEAIASTSAIGNENINTSKIKHLEIEQCSQEENTESAVAHISKAMRSTAEEPSSSFRVCSAHNDAQGMSNLPSCSSEKCCCFYMKYSHKVKNTANQQFQQQFKPNLGFEECRKGIYFDQLSQSENALADGDEGVGRSSPTGAPSGVRFNALNGGGEEEFDSDNDSYSDSDAGGYIYTYKGDSGNDANLSQLIQTCFSCGMPTAARETEANLRPAWQGARQPQEPRRDDPYSPEMDFLEMDFDPGAGGGADGDVDGVSDCDDNTTEADGSDGGDAGAARSNSNCLGAVSLASMSGGTKKASNLSPEEERGLMCLRCQQCGLYGSGERKVTNTEGGMAARLGGERERDSSPSLAGEAASDADDEGADCVGSSSPSENGINNLGGCGGGWVSAPETSPSGEPPPAMNRLERRSVSFHNKLSRSPPNHENMCFSHPYKDNLEGSASENFNCSGCCRRRRSGGGEGSDEVSNLEACPHRRLHQQKEDRVNIAGPVSPPLTPSTPATPTQQQQHLSWEDGHCDLPTTAMVWTERQATLREAKQVGGASACGATAILNVLSAVGEMESAWCVPAALRSGTGAGRLDDLSVSLVEYLVARSRAGTTPRQLVEGAVTATGGCVKGKFFHMFPKRALQLERFLSHWINKGGVPVATRNLQVKAGSTLPDGLKSGSADAWHHQMIFGVGPRGIYLTNPVECVSASVLADQLCSEAVLLVRREDVVSRWPAVTAHHFDEEEDEGSGEGEHVPAEVGESLIGLALQKGARWNSMNVLGQVVCVLKEAAAPEMPQGRRHLTPHVAVPAAFASGVAIFMRADNSNLSLLQEAPQLPYIDDAAE